ncbi:MAG: hypothetical protein P4M15_00795 [Alphaproteobacteria bacterium]|nr:hypothetical protein [Alphaproteobacteria bacterium]
MAVDYCTSSPLTRFRRWLRSVLFYEHWVVGFVDQPIAASLAWQEAPPVQWLTPFDRSCYFADPFPWPGRPDIVLCEVYDIGRQQGRIVALQVGAGRVVGIDPVDFPLAGHLSFPFTFAHEGEVFAMPESCAASRLDIFRWQDGKWRHHATVFDNKPVADSVLFRKDGLFWIFYTDVTHDPHDNVNLVYAESLTGPWKPHPANPVQIGRDRCRGAGNIFEAEGKLYRPAQDCSEVYGGALRIMEITTCTVDSYEEKEVTYMKPTSRRYPDGFHTVTAWGDKCLVDGMRLTFAPSLLWSKIKKRLHIF